MDRSTDRRCHSRDQMDEATPATKSRAPFRPTSRDNLRSLVSLGDYEKLLEEHRWLKTHEAVVASTTDLASKRHHGCLEDYDHASWLGPQWISSTGFQPTVRKTISNRKVAVVRRRRHVSTTNTRRRVFDGTAVNTEPPKAYERHLSRKTATKPSRILEVVSGDATRTAGSLKRPSVVASTDDVGINDERTKPKTPRLEVQDSGTVPPTDVCEVSAEPQAPAAVDPKWKNIGV
ncbi:hypothetical protein MTO96_001400 [Rhipicephalus appendiculatus]